MSSEDRPRERPDEGADEVWLAERLAAAERHEPRPGWQARVWEQIEQREAERRRSWRGRLRRFAGGPWIVAPAALAAAAVLLFVARPGVAPIGLEVDIDPGGAVRRGEGVHPGARLTLRGQTGGAPHAELRVYRNDVELLLRCSTEPPCRRDGDRLTATLVLDAVGAYQPVLLTSASPLPAAAGGLDADAGAALEAGAGVELGDEVQVQ